MGTGKDKHKCKFCNSLDTILLGKYFFACGNCGLKQMIVNKTLNT